LGARYLFGRPWTDAVAIGFCALFSNSVLLGLPIAERAYGAASLASNFAIIAVHSPICYLTGITAMEIARNTGKPILSTLRSILKAMFSNALILGILLGVAVNLSGLPLPGPVTEAVGMMVRAAIPVALFGLGGILVRYRPEGDLRTIGFVMVLSLIVHPAIAFGLGTGLGLPPEALRAAVLTGAMAPGVNAYVFADMYGHARRVAASAVLGGTAATVTNGSLTFPMPNFSAGTFGVGVHYVQVTDGVTGGTSLVWDTSFFRQPNGLLPEVLVARTQTVTMQTPMPVQATPNTQSYGVAASGATAAVGGFIQFSANAGQTIYIDIVGVESGSNNRLADAGLSNTNPALGIFNPNATLFSPGLGPIIAQNDDDGILPFGFAWPINPAVGIGFGSALIQPVAVSSPPTYTLLYLENICFVSCAQQKVGLVSIVVL